MKHLFLVHSHITDLVATQLVKEQGLSIIDVIFLLARNHQTKFPNSLEFPYTHYPIDSFKVNLLFWKSRSKVAELDSWIDSICNGQDFIFYTPQSGMNIFYLISSHPKCNGFAYIEEGLGSYKYFEQIKNKKKESWLRNLLYDLNFKKRAPSVKHFFDLNHPKYLGCYAIGKEAFPDLKNKIVLQLPFEQKDATSNYENVIVLGPYIEYGEVPQAAFLAAYQETIEWLIDKGIQSAHIKHHPAQDKLQSIEPINKINQRFLNQIKITTIEKNVVLENIALNTNANFYLVLGSIGIYADITGNKVYSFAHKIVAKDPTFQDYLDVVPDFYLKKINFI